MAIIMVTVLGAGDSQRARMVPSSGGAPISANESEIAGVDNAQ
jgi:hypothetical protein